MKKTVLILFIGLLLVCIISYPMAIYGKESINLSSYFSYEEEEIADISIDYDNEQDAFSKYLFMTVDSPQPLEEGFELAKEANFKVIALNQFIVNSNSKDTAKKAKLLNKNNFEGMIFYPAFVPLSNKEMKKNVDKFLVQLDSVKKKYPNLVINTILFGNEPDLPEHVFWKGSRDQFFENYRTFANYLKSKNSKYIVGAPGFAYVAKPNEDEPVWIRDFVHFVANNNVPLDFISFHCYSSETKHCFAGRIDYIKSLLSEYNLDKKVKIANTEYDMVGTSLESGQYHKFKDTAWRAAFNIMALMSMTDKGLWMSTEMGGAFRNTDADFESHTDHLWVKNDGTIKPIYYAHKAFGQLAGTTRLEISGDDNNYETFGVLAGKSRKGKSIMVVISNYDQNKLFTEYPEANIEPAPGSNLPPFPKQSADAKVYDKYKVTLKNLPWDKGDKVKFERYIVNDEKKLDLVEASSLDGASEIIIEKDTETPEVQLIKLTTVVSGGRDGKELGLDS